MLQSVEDSDHADLWAAYEPAADILVGKAGIHDLTEVAQYFVFGLTSDVIGDPICLFHWRHVNESCRAI